MPNAQVMMLSTMCGHGMISHSLAKKMIDFVKENRRTPEQCAAALTRFCSCGVFNRRARSAFSKMPAPKFRSLALFLGILALSCSRSTSWRLEGPPGAPPRWCSATSLIDGGDRAPLRAGGNGRRERTRVVGRSGE